MSVSDLASVLETLKFFEQKTDDSLQRSIRERDNLTMLLKQQENVFYSLEKDKRDAINAYRPIKREYVHNYR